MCSFGSILSSPRPWGCFLKRSPTLALISVVPTPVGVFLVDARNLASIKSRPHARGGVSTQHIKALVLPPSSPRPWGCFPGAYGRLHGEDVVPTPVGVFPALAMPALSGWSRPHARGGVSYFQYFVTLLNKSSPRPWGCFCTQTTFATRPTVVPTPVGVFLPQDIGADCLRCRPHARGGVSIFTLIFVASPSSSPRPWGCFSLQNFLQKLVEVVPTPVGVFPQSTCDAAVSRRRPHARGGVSTDVCYRDADPTSSPRPWGCFHPHDEGSDMSGVVPTPVGVFPDFRTINQYAGSRPHARGGVSGS